MVNDTGTGIFIQLPLNFEDHTLMYSLASLVTLIFMVCILLAKARVPQQFLAMLLAGIVASVYLYGKYDIDSVFCVTWSTECMVLVYHPLLIIHMGYSMDMFLFNKSFLQMLLIAVFGTAIFILVIGILFNLFTNKTYITANDVIVSGALVANIDVPHIHIEITKIRSLQAIMNGECIIGSAITLQALEIGTGYFDGFVTTFLHMFSLHMRYILIGVAFGFLVGPIAIKIFTLAYNDSYNALVIVVSFTYITYLICFKFFEGNGVIAAFIVVLMMNTQRYKMTFEIDKNIIKTINGIYQAAELICCIQFSLILFHHLFHGGINAITCVIGFGLYVVGNVTRLLILSIMYPVLNRLGYGFDFPTLFTAFWGARRGSLTLLWLIILIRNKYINEIGSQTISLTLIYCMMTSLLNMTTLKYILKKLGLLDTSTARMSSISSCYKYIDEKAASNLVHFRLKRSYNEVNWTLVYESVKLEGSSTQKDVQIIGRREGICASCHKPVIIEPTKKALMQMLREAQIRVMKSIRVTVYREDDLGYLDKVEIQTLNMAIENALNSNTLTINIEHLVTMCQRKKFINKLTDYMKSIELEDIIQLPDSWWKRRLYSIANSRAFYISFFVMTAVWIIYLIAMIIVEKRKFKFIYRVLRLSFQILCWIYFFLDFCIKVCSLAVINVKRAIKHYFRNPWNVFDFIMLIMMTLYIFDALKKKYFDYSYEEIVQLIRLIRFGELYREFLPAIIKECDKVLDNHLKHCFVVAKTLIMAFDEVLDHLPQLTDNDKIRIVLTRSIQQSKEDLTKYMSVIASAKPAIPNKCNSVQAATSIAKTMLNTVKKLRTTGNLDDYEFKLFRRTTDEMLTYLSTRWIVPMRKSRDRIYNISYLLHDDVTDFIYQHLIMRVWDDKTVVTAAGDHLEGVMFILSGVMKMVYTPDSKILANLKYYGKLPPKDGLNHDRFNEEQIDYYWVSQTVGELPVLLCEPYCADLVTELATRAFIIPYSLLKPAFEMDSDPVNGLESRMWKYTTHNLATSIMKSEPTYSRMATEQLSILLTTSFVPTVNEYQTFVICELIQEVVLLNGTVKDFYTTRLYTAPCIIPRHVRKFWIDYPDCPRPIETKFLIIPTNNVDPYQLMQLEEEICNLSSEKRGREYWSEIGKVNLRRMRNEMMNKKLPTTSYRSSSLRYKYSLRVSTDTNKKAFNLVKIDVEQ